MGKWGEFSPYFPTSNKKIFHPSDNWFLCPPCRRCGLFWMCAGSILSHWIHVMYGMFTVTFPIKNQPNGPILYLYIYMVYIAWFGIISAPTNGPTNTSSLFQCSIARFPIHQRFNGDQTIALLKRRGAENFVGSSLLPIPKSMYGILYICPQAPSFAQGPTIQNTYLHVTFRDWFGVSWFQCTFNKNAN